MNVQESRNQKGVAVRLWQKYVCYVDVATAGNNINRKEDITYWRERLFTKFITYLLPTCFIALVPGVIMAFKNGYLFIAISDITVVTAIGFVSLNAKMNLYFRKVFVVVILYFLSIILIINLSLLGPGIIYLLAISIVVTVIFPRYWGYWTVIVNLLICVGCAFVIELKLFHSPLIADYELGVWIAVSSNLVFLSLVMVMLISSTIGGLEKTVRNELLSKNELKKEVVKRRESNELLIQSEDQYKSLFFFCPSPIWVLDKNSLQFLQVNEAAISNYGYTREEFLAMNIKDIKTDAANLERNLDKNQITGLPLNIVAQHRRKNK